MRYRCIRGHCFFGPAVDKPWSRRGPACPVCGMPSSCPGGPYTRVGEFFEAHYNRGLGKVLYSKKERDKRVDELSERVGAELRRVDHVEEMLTPSEKDVLLDGDKVRSYDPEGPETIFGTKKPSPPPFADFADEQA